jgi:hypothetical protein
MSLGKYFIVCMVGLMLMIIIANAPAGSDPDSAAAQTVAPSRHQNAGDEGR